MKNRFFSTILGFILHWDYKHYDEYISQKILNLSTTNKIHLKCDVFDGSIVNCSRQSILYGFVLRKPEGYKVISQLETIHYKKRKKSVLNTLTFCLEDDNHKENNFNQEVITFTTRLVKI